MSGDDLVSSSEGEVYLRTLEAVGPVPRSGLSRQARACRSARKKGLQGTLTQQDSRFYIVTPGVAPKPAKWLVLKETDLPLGPDLHPQGLHPLGHQTLLRAPGKDQVKELVGSGDPFKGEGLFEISSPKRSEEVCLHLEHLGEMFPDPFLVVGCDHAPAHCSRDTREYLKDKQEGLEVVYFPTYSPNLNGIEHLGRFLRGQVTRDTVEENLDAEGKAIMAGLDDLSFEQIIQTLGTLKKLMKTL